MRLVMTFQAFLMVCFIGVLGGFLVGASVGYLFAVFFYFVFDNLDEHDYQADSVTGNERLIVGHKSVDHPTQVSNRHEVFDHVG